MAHAQKNASAFAAVIQRVLSENFRQRIAGSGPDDRSAEIGAESFAIARCALFPLWRGIIELIDTGRTCAHYEGNGPERVETEAVYLLSRRWTSIARGKTPRGDVCRIGGGVQREGQRLRSSHFRRSSEDRDHEQNEYCLAHIHRS